MKINCEKEILLENINIVLKAVSNKTTLPILECILLTADENGFRLTSNNLELGIETSNIETEIYEKGTIALESKIFFEIIRNLPENSVNIETDEKNTVTIKSGKSEFKILGQPGNEFPLLPNVEKNINYLVNSNIIKNMIKQTIFSVATEDTRPVLTGELIEIKNETLSIVAIDGFRISFRRIKAEKTNEHISAIAPAKTLNEIIKIIPDKNNDIITIYFTDKHILFELENCIMVSRLLEGEFLKYEPIFTDDYTTLIEVNRELLLKGLERATLISKDSNKNPVKLKIENNNLVITSNTEFGESYEEVKIEMDGKELEIGFNPKFLIDALKAIDDDTIAMQFMTSLSPCIIRGLDNENYKYLILPLRLKN